MLIFVPYPQEDVLTLLNSLNNLMYFVLQELDLHNNNQLLRAKVSISNNIRVFCVYYSPCACVCVSTCNT